MMTTLTLELPDEVFSSLRRSPEEFVREMRLAAAVFWYHRGALSQERAAQVAGLDRIDFLLTLASRKLDVFVVDLDELREELERGSAAHRERVALGSREMDHASRRP